MTSPNRGDWSVERSVLEKCKRMIVHLEKAVDVLDTGILKVNPVEFEALTIDTAVDLEMMFRLFMHKRGEAIEEARKSRSLAMPKMEAKR